jgi:5-methylcytosine-specific restriction endonuclease McrA
MKSTQSSPLLKKKPKFNPGSATRSAMRRVFSRSPVVKEVLDAGRRTVPRFNKDGSRHKVDSVEHQCNSCQGWFKKKDVEVDHINEVVDVTEGFLDWNTFYSRLWSDRSNLQILCSTCHDAKSKKANKQRRENKLLKSENNCASSPSLTSTPEIVDL